MDQDAIARVIRRKSGADKAKELVGLLSEDEVDCPHFVEGLLRKLGEMLAPPPAPAKAKPPVPVARLGDHPIHFGRYKGRTFDTAPLDYLDWLCAQQETHLADLRQYLRHPGLEAHRRAIGAPQS